MFRCLFLLSVHDFDWDVGGGVVFFGFGWGFFALASDVFQSSFKGLEGVGWRWREVTVFFGIVSGSRFL